MALRYEATIEIDADPDTVWRVLTDLAAYRDWNPYIIEARGRLRADEPVELKILAPDIPAFSIKTLVTAVSPPTHLALGWESDDPGLFSGGADFRMSPVPAGTQVTFTQTVDGDPSVDGRGLGDRNDLALEMMLVALEARCKRESRR